MVNRPLHIVLFCLLPIMAPIDTSTASTATTTQTAPSWPPGMENTWNDLVPMIKQAPWGAAEWTRGIYLGIRLMSFGIDGIPPMRQTFARTANSEAAFLSGAYLAVHGGRKERAFVRKELESNPKKQTWLKGLVGDAKALSAAMRSGSEWQPAIRQLPSTSGCLLLAKECMLSRDPLVRRAGLYWGFWLADRQYWKMAAKLSASDADPLTKRFAAALIRRHQP